MPDEERRRTIGRREGDIHAAQVAAYVEGDEPLIPASWTLGRATKWLGFVVLLVTAIVTSVTFLSARVATRDVVKSEVKAAVEPILDTLSSYRDDQDRRIKRLEARQDTLFTVRQLIPAMARFQCITAERDRSQSLADAAGLPCDSLLSRRR